MWNRMLFGALALVLLCDGALASEMDLRLREARYLKDFQRSGRYFVIPYQLLMAIARQESDCNPLVINIAGRDYHPKSSQEALALIREARMRKQGYDLGLMQINSEWLERLGIDPALLLAPNNNIFMGASILAGEIKKRGFGWEAIGHYHSPKSARALAYARKIKGHLLQLLRGGKLGL